MKILQRIWAILNYKIIKLFVYYNRIIKYEKVSDCCQYSYYKLKTGLINMPDAYICNKCGFYCKLIERLKEK